MDSHKSIPLKAFINSRMFAVFIVCIALLSLFIPGMAFAQSSPAPDSLTLTASPDEILTGDSTVIIARVTSGGVPCDGCPVTFTVDRSDLVYFPVNNTNVTAPNGETMIYLTANGTSGTVIVTAEAKVPDSTRTLTATITVKIVDWGTIGGTVFNLASVPMTGAQVTLKDEYGNVYRNYQSPQNTSVMIAPVASFAYYRIPSGKYSVSWSTDNLSGSLPVTVSPGTATVIFNENRSFLFPGYKDAPAGYTTLYGYVLDKVKDGVPSTPVMLFTTAYNSSGKTWDTLTLVAKTMTDHDINYSGLYNFSNVPYGTYKVVASKMDAAGNDRTYYSIVTLNSSGQVAYIVIPDLSPHHPFPTFTPTPVVTPASQPTSAPYPAQATGNDMPAQADTVKAMLLVALIIVAVGLLVFALLLTSRR